MKKITWNECDWKNYGWWYFHERERDSHATIFMNFLLYRRDFILFFSYNKNRRHQTRQKVEKNKRKKSEWEKEKFYEWTFHTVTIDDAGNSSIFHIKLIYIFMSSISSMNFFLLSFSLWVEDVLPNSLVKWENFNSLHTNKERF